MFTDDETKAIMNKVDAENYRGYTTSPNNQCFDQEEYDRLLKDGSAFNSEIRNYGMIYLRAITQEAERATLLEVREKLDALWYRLGANLQVNT